MSPMSSKNKRLIFNSMQFQQNFLMSPDEQKFINQMEEQNNQNLAPGNLN